VREGLLVVVHPSCCGGLGVGVGSGVASAAAAASGVRGRFGRRGSAARAAGGVLFMASDDGP
jgi:hypothetical protein